MELQNGSIKPEHYSLFKIKFMQSLLHFGYFRRILRQDDLQAEITWSFFHCLFLAVVNIPSL